MLIKVTNIKYNIMRGTDEQLIMSKNYKLLSAPPPSETDVNATCIDRLYECARDEFVIPLIMSELQFKCACAETRDGQVIYDYYDPIGITISPTEAEIVARLSKLTAFF